MKNIVTFNLINQNAELTKENEELKKEIKYWKESFEFVNNLTPDKFTKRYYEVNAALSKVINQSQ